MRDTDGDNEESTLAFPTGGEMARLIRAHDWASTSIGPISQWPQSLKTVTAFLLAAPVPLVLLWGAEGVMIYNDPYSVFAHGAGKLGKNVADGNSGRAPLLAFMLGTSALEMSAETRLLLRDGTSLVIITAVAFLLLQTVDALQEFLLRQYRVDVENNYRARAVRTQVLLLRRLAVAVIGILTFASMLIVFETVRRFGTTILASAGVACPSLPSGRCLVRNPQRIRNVLSRHSASHALRRRREPKMMQKADRLPRGYVRSSEFTDSHGAPVQCGALGSRTSFSRKSYCDGRSTWPLNYRLSP